MLICPDAHQCLFAGFTGFMILLHKCFSRLHNCNACQDLTSVVVVLISKYIRYCCTPRLQNCCCYYSFATLEQAGMPKSLGLFWNLCFFSLEKFLSFLVV
ncbi:hypothetical protein U1Q18_042431 [Sarracenia purpurea var. burkii]